MFCCIPSSMFMSKLSASRSKIGKVLDMLAAVVGEKVVLALHTLYESFQPDSEWKAYLDIMPPLNEMNNVLFWSEQDIALLQCPQEWQCPLIARARKQKNKVAKLFSELQPVMNNFQTQPIHVRQFCMGVRNLIITLLRAKHHRKARALHCWRQKRRCKKLWYALSYGTIL